MDEVCNHEEIYLILFSTDNPHAECVKCGKELPLPELPK